MGSLIDSTLQARFNCGVFTGRRKDKAVGAKVAQEHGVDEATGNYWKNALRCDELKAIQGIANSARQEFYRNSTEWLEGVRVMPVDAFHRFAPIFRQYSTAWDAAVKTFLDKYLDLVEVERGRLKALFDPNDYPHPSDIGDKFYMEFRVFPFPDVTTDWRVKIMQEEVAGVRAQMQQDFAEAQQSAVKDMYARISERMEKMATILGEPDKRLFDSLFEHTKELCDDLSVLNFTNDPAIEQLRQDMLKNLGSLNPEAVRVSTGIPGGVRENAAGHAKRIRDKIKNMGF